VPVGLVPGVREAAEQDELSVKVHVMAAGLAPVEFAPAELARISMFSRLLLLAVLCGIPTDRIRIQAVAPGLVEPARI